VGPIEALVDSPAAERRGVAVITHPHPLQGGTGVHKIPHALAKRFVERGWMTVRPNFRGVGGSAGGHDGGRGEADDILSVLEFVVAAHPDVPIALAGFSFGAYVQARVAAVLTERGRSPDLVVLAGMPFGVVKGERHYDTPHVPKNTLVIHGESDSVVPLARVFEWARPQRLAIVAIPGAGHFFTGYPGTFEAEIDRYLAAFE
jgi:alpha/beta superfamily hydrolase